MKAESCREWRESLGAYALGQLPDEEQIPLEAHLEGCRGCRTELEALNATARLLPLADPDLFGSAPTPPASLGERIAATIGAEQKATRRRRRRFGLAFGGVAAAAAAAVLAIFVLAGGGEAGPEQHVTFRSLPPGMEIAAKLEPRSFGTEIHMYVKGVSSGTLCRVYLRQPNGTEISAGSFRYRWGDDDNAVLSSALDLSKTGSIVVRVGGRTFSAPVRASA
jgi:anti-sigma factor RsiW